MLKVENLSVKKGERQILSNISFSLENKAWLMLAGPNGAGKTTLIKAVSQNTGYTGSVMVDNINAASFKPRDLAKYIGVLAQSHYVNYSFTVYEVVKLGRYSYSKGFLKSSSEADDEKIKAALSAVGMLPLKDRSVMTLSGGELRRTFLAQLIAQDPKIIILDEPANDLDLKYQRLIFDLIAAWIEETGRCAITAVHDLSLAKAYGTHALLLSEGKLIGSGDTTSVLSRENLNKVYSMDVYEWMDILRSYWKNR